MYMFAVAYSANIGGTGVSHVMKLQYYDELKPTPARL